MQTPTGRSAVATLHQTGSPALPDSRCSHEQALAPGWRDQEKFSTKRTCCACFRSARRTRVATESTARGTISSRISVRSDAAGYCRLRRWRIVLRLALPSTASHAHDPLFHEKNRTAIFAPLEIIARTSSRRAAERTNVRPRTDTLRLTHDRRDAGACWRARLPEVEDAVR